MELEHHGEVPSTTKESQGGRTTQGGTANPRTFSTRAISRGIFRDPYREDDRSSGPSEGRDGCSRSLSSKPSSQESKKSQEAIVVSPSNKVVHTQLVKIEETLVSVFSHVENMAEKLQHIQLKHIAFSSNLNEINNKILSMENTQKSEQSYIRHFLSEFEKKNSELHHNTVDCVNKTMMECKEELSIQSANGLEDVLDKINSNPAPTTKNIAGLTQEQTEEVVYEVKRGQSLTREGFLSMKRAIHDNRTKVTDLHQASHEVLEDIKGGLEELARAVQTNESTIQEGSLQLAALIDEIKQLPAKTAEREEVPQGSDLAREETPKVVVTTIQKMVDNPNRDVPPHMASPPINQMVENPEGEVPPPERRPPFDPLVDNHVMEYKPAPSEHSETHKERILEQHLAALPEDSPDDRSELDDMYKMLKSDVPSAKEWPRFSAEGEYNHLEFIEWVDNLKEDMRLPDVFITSKLGIVFTGMARLWFNEKRRDGTLTWNQWRDEICRRFGTPQWKRKMLRAFEKDRWSAENRSDPVTWLVTQRRRLEAAKPRNDIEDTIYRILDLCPGDLEHAIRCRLQDITDFSALCSTFEEVITRTSITRVNKPVPTREWKTTATAGSSNTPNATSTKPPGQQRVRKCYNCNSTDPDHNYRLCKTKGKAVMVIDREEDTKDDELLAEDIEGLETYNLDTFSNSEEDETSS